jgi:hypothetical protein
MKTLLITVFLLTGIYIHAQVVNVNPDPNGNPWIAGDGLPMTPEMEAETLAMYYKYLYI